VVTRDILAVKGGGTMQISARNQLRGTIKDIKLEGLAAEVIIDVGGQEIVSSITAASARRLGLQRGDDVVAIIKASEVIVGK
jgi:molybdopterin-binding protein